MASPASQPQTTNASSTASASDEMAALRKELAELKAGIKDLSSARREEARRREAPGG